MVVRHLTIANSNAKNVTPDLVARIKDAYALGNGSLKGEVVVTKDLYALERKIAEYKSEELTFVGILGGDGGVMHVRTAIESIWGYRPRYALFPGGTQMNIQRAAGLKNKESSITLAKYIAQKASLGELEKSTISFPSLDINGMKGFNVGLGLVPKLLWMYDGKSAEQYARLEEALQTAEPTKYLEIYEKVRKQYPEEIIKEKGLVGVCRAAWKSLNGLLNAHSFEGDLLSTPLKGGIIVDGEKKVFSQPPLGLYISCYEEINLGLSFCNPVPLPEARTEPGRFQVIAPYGNPLHIALEFPRVIRGKHLSKAEYFFASVLQAQTQIAEVDGEILLRNGFSIKYDGEARLISPLASS